MATTSAHRAHPARTLVIFLVVLAALYGLVALGRTWTPRLGLDLRGGTTITLTARNTTGKGSVDPTSLELARSIIEQRVNALGVGESEVTTEGGNHIVVSVPNVQRDELVRLVGQTAQLGFRNVYAVAQSVPAASPSPSASGSASSNSSASATPTSTPPPGLPTAPATIKPSASASPTPSATPSTDTEASQTLDQRLKWQPTQEDQTAFQAWNCGDPVDDVADKVLFACDDAAQKYLLGPVIISGTEVTKANSGIPQNGIGYVVTLQFNKTGTDAFLKATTHLASLSQQPPMNQFAIVLDSKVISAPSVSSPIAGGSAEISGNFTNEIATELANVLNYGALPLSFDISSVENVSASLGGNQLRAGIIAGLIGLGLVVLYSLLYYRGLVVVVIGSLIVAAATTYACMVLLGQSMGFALNLPGIAGAIVAIGVTADSFIIYFERIRDEIREGRSLRTAIESGWRKARGTIVVADAVSLLSAIVLFILAIGSVRGFAFTLGLTTAIDLVIVFFFTKPLMTLLGRTTFYGEGRRGSGLDANHMGVTRDALLGRRPRTNRKGA